MQSDTTIKNADGLQTIGAKISRQGNPPQRNNKQLLSDKLVDILLWDIVNKDKRLQQKFPDIDFALITRDLPETYREILAENRMKFQDILKTKPEIKSENGEILNNRIANFLAKYFNYEPSLRKVIIKKVSNSLKSKIDTLSPIPEETTPTNPTVSRLQTQQGLEK